MKYAGITTLFGLIKILVEKFLFYNNLLKMGNKLILPAILVASCNGIRFIDDAENLESDEMLN